MINVFQAQYSPHPQAVIPAKAGIHAVNHACGLAWAPAFAGATGFPFVDVNGSMEGGIA